MRNVTKSIVQILSNHIDLNPCLNNKKAYISQDCPFCGEHGKIVFRYNVKLKVGKFFCCGKSFKEKNQLLEELKYLQWHKDKLSMNYSRFAKSKQVDDNLDLPF